MRLYRVLLALLLIGLAVVGAAPAARAAGPADPAGGAITDSLTVSTFVDEWDPPNAQGALTLCSFREALERVYNNDTTRGCPKLKEGATDIRLELPAGTYKLTRPEALPDLGSGRIITINSTATIDGGKLAGRNTGIFRIVGGALLLLNVTLTNANREFGGALTMGDGLARLTDVKLTDNGMLTGPVITQEGGAINNNVGTLFVVDSTFKGNQAVRGGAVSVKAGNFIGGKFIANQAGTGGAFYVWEFAANPVTVSDLEFINNKSINSGPLVATIDDLLGGGAIANNGNLLLHNVFLRDNKTQQNKGGGALLNMPAAWARLERCAIASNVANFSSSSLSSYGGGILNQGILDLVSCSINNTQANIAGGIYNAAGASAHLFNSTISNNYATDLHGGLVNAHAFFDVNTGGASMLLDHVTMASNTSGSGSAIGNSLYEAQDHSIYLANSIIDSNCSGIVYTYGRSVITGPCNSIPEPQDGGPGAVDQVNVPPANIGILPLTQGASAWAGFRVNNLAGAAALDIGRDDQFGCGNLEISHVDQNLASRPFGACDAGAIEAGANPPQYQSEPAPDQVNFPIVNLSVGEEVAAVEFVVRNTGGGALEYQIIDRNGPYGYETISRDIAQPAQGVLFGGNEAHLSFFCEPHGPGDFFHDFEIRTNLRTHSDYRYTFHCAAAGEEAMASTEREPGATNMDPVEPGDTAHSELAVSNRGSAQDLTVTSALAESQPGFAMNVTPPSQPADGPAAPDAPQAYTLHPGQTLNVDVSCTPSSFGVILNTLRFTTSDPGNPVIDYNLACEGLVPPLPEPLHPGALYANASQVNNVAVSPDGTQVLAAPWANNGLRAYVRNTATGALSSPSTLAVANMGRIYGLAYSPDGTQVYYTSSLGNGLVVAQRSGASLAASQVITIGTKFRCGFLYCPLGSMDDARGVAVSPDNQYVYVAGFDDGTLTIFKRNQTTNTLSPAQIFTRTIQGVNTLGGANRIAISPDGTHVYVTAFTDNTVAVFQRQADGRHTFQHAYKDGAPGFSHLGWPNDVAVSPDGEYVYVTSFGDNALTVL
ncbi:MAG: YncE family protein, partial [Anaerolineales bacterium]